MRCAGIAAAVLIVALVQPLAGQAAADPWPDACEESTLPADDTDDAAEQLTLVCLPTNFNGTLLVYAHGYVRPQEPLALPEELGAAQVADVIDGLLLLGFGVATSSYTKNGYAVEAAESDLNRLVDHIGSSEPDVDRVLLLGASEGGLITTMLVEEYPETYAGGLAMCGPLAGIPYQIDYFTDVRALFDYFYPDVFPFGVRDVPLDAYARWDAYQTEIAAAIEASPEGTAQVFGVARVPCDAVTVDDAANCTQDILAYSVFGTNDLVDTAGGWPADNAEKVYQGSTDDAALNAGIERYDADPDAVAYTRRYYRPTGRLERPLVTLHTTSDPVVPDRHELMYFRRAALAGSADYLTVLPVDRAGHCEFTAAEVIGALSVLLLQANQPLTSAFAEPLEALYDAIDLSSRDRRLAEQLQNKTRELVAQVKDALGRLQKAEPARAE